MQAVIGCTEPPVAIASAALLFLRKKISTNSILQINTGKCQRGMANKLKMHFLGETKRKHQAWTRKGQGAKAGGGWVRWLHARHVHIWELHRESC
jgi:hypothetical protein